MPVCNFENIVAITTYLTKMDLVPLTDIDENDANMGQLIQQRKIESKEDGGSSRFSGLFVAPHPLSWPLSHPVFILL